MYLYRETRYVGCIPISVYAISSIHLCMMMLFVLNIRVNTAVFMGFAVRKALGKLSVNCNERMELKVVPNRNYNLIIRSSE